MTHIYGLFASDAPTHIRYVGRTRKNPRKRFLAHRCSAKRSIDPRFNLHVYRWWRKVEQLGSIVNFLILDTCQSEDATLVENAWITEMLLNGHQLTNIDLGWNESLDMNGEDATSALFTNEEVVTIRERLANGETKIAIAEELEVGLTCIRNIYIGQTYKDAGGPFGQRGKLKAEDARQIRGLYAIGGHTSAELAILFNCSKSNIHMIISGATWKDAGGPTSSGFKLSEADNLNPDTQTLPCRGYNL